MTDEEVNRKFDVVADHLVSLTMQVDRIAGAQVQTERFVNTLGATMLAGCRDVNTKIDALVGAQIRTEEGLQRTNENLMKTDDNLRNLTAVVDRSLREGRHGGS